MIIGNIEPRNFGEKREVIVVINFEKVAMFEVWRFPFAKTDEYSRPGGDKVGTFGSPGEFAADVTKNVFLGRIGIFDARVVDVDVTHTVAEHFGNDAINFVGTSGRAKRMIGRSLNQFARHALGLIAAGRVFDHFVNIDYINY